MFKAFPFTFSCVFRTNEVGEHPSYKLEEEEWLSPTTHCAFTIEHRAQSERVVITGGASPSKQPSHFQVTKVVRQVIPSPSLPLLFPPILLPSLQNRAP